MPPLRGLILLRRIQGIPGPRFSDERGCALWHTAGSDLWEVAGLLRAAEHCLVSHAEALKRAPPLPRRPWHLCGVALVTAHAVVSKGGENDHAH
jgi:hypothetical protein